MLALFLLGLPLVKVDASSLCLKLPLANVDASSLCLKLPLVKVDANFLCLKLPFRSFKRRKLASTLTNGSLSQQSSINVDQGHL